MRARRTVKERDIVKILVFGYDKTISRYLYLAGLSWFVFSLILGIGI